MYMREGVFMSQYPYDQPPQQYPNPNDPYSGQYQGQGQYPPQQPSTAYGQSGYGDPSLQQQQYPPMQQPYPQSQSYQNPYNPYEMPLVQPNQGGGGLAITSMVLGIISIVFCWFFYLSLPVAIVGLILSIVARRSPVRRGIATAGLVCSIIGLVFSLCDGGLVLYALIHAASTSY
jgi:hypothetical protein